MSFCDLGQFESEIKHDCMLCAAKKRLGNLVREKDKLENIIKNAEKVLLDGSSKNAEENEKELDIWDFSTGSYQKQRFVLESTKNLKIGDCICTLCGSDDQGWFSAPSQVIRIEDDSKVFLKDYCGQTHCLPDDRSFIRVKEQEYLQECSRYEGSKS
jgi:hypothetical protein